MYLHQNFLLHVFKIRTQRMTNNYRRCVPGGALSLSMHAAATLLLFLPLLLLLLLLLFLLLLLRVRVRSTEPGGRFNYNRRTTASGDRCAAGAVATAAAAGMVPAVLLRPTPLRQTPTNTYACEGER